MIELLSIIGMLCGIASIAYVVSRGRLDRLARERLAEFRDHEPLEEADEGVPPRRGLKRYRWLPWLSAAVVGGLLSVPIGLPVGYAVAAGVVWGLIGWQIEEMLHVRTVRRFEEQLADAVDLMVAAVKAGASLQGALESASSNAGRPLRPQFEEVVGRIRFGDDPVEALTDMEERVPLETVRLFAVTLAVNWQVGGRLAQTLANVGRTIRDRIELGRRMHAMTTQARVSVFSVMGVTYFIAALIWRNDPSRMQAFLASMIGQSAVIAAVVLQGIGIAWISRLSRVRF